MKEKVLLSLGLLLIGVVGLSWVLKGFDGFYIFLIYLSWLCFTSPDKVIDAFEQIKTYSFKQLLSIVLGLLLSVSMALGIILFCKYIMKDVLHQTGFVKIIVQYVIVIIALIPSTLLFGKMLQEISKKGKK